MIGLSLLLGIALPNALSGLEGGAHVFFSNSILVGAFSVVILKALIIDLPNFIARHADERTKQSGIIESIRIIRQPYDGKDMA